jgi:hypothetical protein
MPIHPKQSGCVSNRNAGLLMHWSLVRGYGIQISAASRTYERRAERMGTFDDCQSAKVCRGAMKPLLERHTGTAIIHQFPVRIGDYLTIDSIQKRELRKN